MKKRSEKLGMGFVICILVLIFMVSFTFAQETPYEKALEAYAKKDFETAIRYLKDYASQKPNAQAYYLLGYAQYKLKHLDDSAKHFREAYLINPAFDPKSIKFDGK
ncbi:MAG: tetratricopeptide repeat protein [Nitrospirae bacterium]|nr:tetratricopeptide repeat protein [Nitrospirota bacterium]